MLSSAGFPFSTEYLTIVHPERISRRKRAGISCALGGRTLPAGVEHASGLDGSARIAASLEARRSSGLCDAHAEDASTAAAAMTVFTDDLQVRTCFFGLLAALIT